MLLQLRLKRHLFHDGGRENCFEDFGKLGRVLQDEPFARRQLGEQDFRLVSEGPDEDDVRLHFASAQYSIHKLNLASILHLFPLQGHIPL